MSKNVMVTTKHRGVFAGVLVAHEGDRVTLKDVRMCVYWTSAMRGVLGLAEKGPCDSCRITQAVAQGVIDGVTAVFDMTDDAAARWGCEPWG